MQFDNKETETIQDDAPAETFVAENIVHAEEILDEKEDIEMQRLLRILLCFSCFGLLKLNLDHKLMEMNFRKKKSFLFIRYPFTKNSLSFVTAIKVRKIQFNIYSLFFRVLKILIFSCFSVNI